MTVIKQAPLPRDDRGNDPNDHRTDKAYLERLEAEQAVKSSAKVATQPMVFDLRKFSLNGYAAQMEAKMLAEKFILGLLAILGQSTVIYAKSNTGKTLLTIWLLIQAILSGDIDAGDVYYVNADDNHRGLTFKLKLAERYGFHMLAPGYNGFKAEDLADYLAALVQQETASGKILILDTVKKFTDIMRKDKASAFGENVRQFVSHGGSVVMLAHVNKHRGEDGKVIFAGTSDLVDDADCAYTLDTLSEDAGIRTVIFQNFKSRGDAVAEDVYSYRHGEGVSYQERLDSIRAVTAQERLQAEKRNSLDARRERNQEAIDAIRECLRDGVVLKTELVKEAAGRSGISRPRIARALKEHTGTNAVDFEYWHVTIGEKNAHVFALNYGG